MEKQAILKSKIEKNSKDGTPLAFIKGVAKYFMEFLETDFHKRRNPKRNIKLQNEDNLLVGLNLKKYPSFNKLAWKAINHSFDKNIINSIRKGVHKADIPKNLLELIRSQIIKISDKEIDNIIKKSVRYIKNSSILYADDYNKAVSVSLEEISKIIKKDLILPFVRNLEKPLSDLNLGDDNTIYLIEEELTDILINSTKNKITKILNFLINKEKIDVARNFKSVFRTEDVKNSLTEFFESFKVADLFNEIFEIEKNKNILDKKEFYLYFCDMTFNRVKYPVFYIPFNIKKDGNGFQIDFDAQVYINKKALDYIVQEYNKDNSKKGNLKLISERIIYLTQHKTDLVNVLQSIISEIINFFELGGEVDLRTDNIQVAKGLFVKLSNSCYINLFDKSDEALINDYEDILKLLSSGNSVLGDAFNRLIEDFIYNNPKNFSDVVYDEWDNLTTSDKLVFNTPIPLNSEQRQILSAINKNDCNYISVEGPPGTGKSHTITAIVFDAILKKKSVLVLSDKKEALDVVEDKISETMNKVRFDKNFQNPILRLGKTGNTYSKILSSASIENIKTHYKAVKEEFSSIEDNIKKISNTLKEDIEAEVLAHEKIDINEIFEIINLEELFYKKENEYFEIDEILREKDSVIDLEEFKTTFVKLRDRITNKELNHLVENHFAFNLKGIKQIVKFEAFTQILFVISSNVEEVEQHFSEKIKNIGFFNNFSDKDLDFLQDFIKSYEGLKNWLLGYVFRKKKIEKLNSDFKQHFYTLKTDQPHKLINELKILVEVFVYANKLKDKVKTEIDFDYLSIFYKILFDKNFALNTKSIIELISDIEYLKKGLGKYPKTLNKMGIDLLLLKDFYENKFFEIDELEFSKFIRYINLKQKITKQFKDIPILNYVTQKKNLESLVTTKMTYIMDKSVVKFYNENLSTARTLRNIIKGKQRFPKNDFAKLKEAFPCILAGIRDYAEYIPLEPKIFDLVIIDEASQVSIAQAFPALLRAKKMLILGDNNQFSNVKASLARTDTNREFLNNLENVFKQNVSKEDDKLIKLKKFDIKTSILEFFGFINNYNVRLLKYFRGYKEIISYSKKYFYQDSLQVMKIRGKNIDEVLKFSFIKHDNKQEIIPNTNKLEVDFIISELRKLKEKDKNSSVGIITPHTNQQKLIMEQISKLPESSYFFEKLKLKIMTFDTCQGEERDIIYYSMVATEEQDHLWGVFIKDLSSVDLEEEGKIKAQRLNVGFSRAKECMHFVLSKTIDKYSGSIGEAIRHYSCVLDEAKKEKDISSVDKRSKMEPKIMNWFYQTKFWSNNKDKIEFVPQFKIGEYLTQLDKFYKHPNYIVDFLLTYQDENNDQHKIIIEYDGFQEHFKNIDEVNEFNYEHYYSDKDLFRQKVLEGYGYKFIRINKFNLGENPIETLDNRIAILLKGNFGRNNILSNVHKTIEDLQNGEAKECPKCGKVKPLSDFRDSNLIRGYGRFCNSCKNIPTTQDNSFHEKLEESVSKFCPLCGSDMVLRNGRYGEFYGCSRYPYCRGTRKVS